MTLDQITQWVATGESETIEFKRTTGERREAMHVLCAMLNLRGGRVLFGVAPDGRVIGQQVSDRTLEELAHEIREIDPPAFPSIERVIVEGDHELVVVTVSQGPGRPYSYRGQSYRRVGNVSARMSRDEYNRMLVERLHAERRWENEPAEGWTVADLDADEIVRTGWKRKRRSACCGSGGFAVSIGRSFSTTASFTATSSSCCNVPSVTCARVFRWPDA